MKNLKKSQFNQRLSLSKNKVAAYLFFGGIGRIHADIFRTVTLNNEESPHALLTTEARTLQNRPISRARREAPPLDIFAHAVLGPEIRFDTAENATRVTGKFLQR